ncbi:MAG TPA: hypothetical protein VJ063_17860 [Verrucomicrobiae bacterium]|nr:hypothetical protein [Verrucomicrobiae bacterium]
MALLALQEAQHPFAGIAQQHAGMFRVAGIAGCDIQCMPYQICRHCDAPYRHNQGESKKCLLCAKDALETFRFSVRDGRSLTRVDVERDYYRNTHLVLGRSAGAYGVNPKEPSGSADQPFPRQVVQHLANMLRDSNTVPPRKLRSNFLAFTLGWFSHVVSDALFKGVYPQSARVGFYGHQYNMAMLPAAETLTMTDIAYDFGVHWPTWHDELLQDKTDGGALRHLAMGNEARFYDNKYWTTEFGRPDPRIGNVIDAVRPINRQWFHRMYLTPDYSAPSPRLDRRKLDERADWTFHGSDLGQVRAYAIGTGWYQTFIKGIDVYIRIVNAASQLAGLNEKSETSGSWSLWRRVVEEAIAGKRSQDWGSRLSIDRAVERLPGHAAKIVLPKPATDYQKQIADLSRKAFKRGADFTLMIGPPAFNEQAAAFLCREDAVRLKYGDGLAALVKYHGEPRVLHLAGFSDFGDRKLIEWIKTQARH